MKLIDISAGENKKIVKQVLARLKIFHNKTEKITSLYIDENENIFVNVDCGCNPRYFFHLWIDGSGKIVFIKKYLWGSFSPTLDNFGRIDCAFRFPICGKTNNGSYLYDIKRGKDIICLTSLGDFSKNENTGELEAEATITIKGDFYIAFKIDPSGRIKSLITSNVNDTPIDPNETGFNLNQCIRKLEKEVTQLLSVEKEAGLENNQKYTYELNVLGGEK